MAGRTLALERRGARENFGASGQRHSQIALIGSSGLDMIAKEQRFRVHANCTWICAGKWSTPLSLLVGVLVGLLLRVLLSIASGGWSGATMKHFRTMETSIVPATPMHLEAEGQVFHSWAIE
jgi:hypothetical protein